MNLLLSSGLIFSFAAIAVILLKWWNIKCVGVTPVHTLTFIAILFTSGLDVGLIMFPLTEFAGYANLTESPEYSFANPLAIEFGYWAFLIWGFYFLTCFYFCIIEPRVKFFELPLVKLINNIVIIGTCAFTAYLLLVNLPWYLPQIGDGESVVPTFYLIVFASIALAVYSSSSMKLLRLLSLGSSFLFIALIVIMWFRAYMTDNGNPADFLSNAGLISEYFTNIYQFMLPLNDYHAFYLFWWFSWSIMIGQFTARFVSGIRTWQLLLAMMVFPSIAIGVWFTILYHYHTEGIQIAGFINVMMIVVGILMVVNSLDSLIRLYTDNLNLTVERFGLIPYIVGNLVLMCALTLLFQLDFLKIEWVGALVIGLYFSCFIYIMLKKRHEVASIKGPCEESALDYKKDKLTR